MNTTVALSTDIHALLQLRLGIVFFEKRTSMHFLRDKMMKGEPCFSLTTRTDANGICHKKHPYKYTSLIYIVQTIRLNLYR